MKKLQNQADRNEILDMVETALQSILDEFGELPKDNPNVQLLVDLKEKGTKLVVIYNLSGQLIKKLTVQNGTQIDLTGFPKGVYFAVASNGNQVKFVK